MHGGVVSARTRQGRYFVCVFACGCTDLCLSSKEGSKKRHRRSATYSTALPLFAYIRFDSFCVVVRVGACLRIGASLRACECACVWLTGYNFTGVLDWDHSVLK